ncbi:phosphatase PAP2 family protein [Corynebacterium bovis]|uniref:phosphatase PAP2 family protein n=1 Tax=Corynebacterium bovis TaxID=36808 RepID=UPI003080CFCD
MTAVPLAGASAPTATAPAPTAPAATAPAAPDATAPADTLDPNRTALLGQYYDWWTPAVADGSSEDGIRTTAFRGDVTPSGAAVLGRNDEVTVGVNHAGAADVDQAHRALTDADMDWRETLGDALGPVLGGYLLDGVAEGRLPLTADAIAQAGKSSTTGTAKQDFNYPRPFLRTGDKEKGSVGDRSRNGENDLRGLAPELDIHRIDDWGTKPDSDEPHSAEYDIYAGTGPKGVKGINQAFPSGHTTFAYGIGLELAELLPELGPQVVTRASEAGNNRVVLGVHYALDIMGGRITGHVNTASTLSSPDYVTGVLLPARAEFTDYLTGRCAADGHGATLADCIRDTGAADTGGYTNAFTDPVSTAPVTGRASALDAYRARMTYGFDRVTPGGDAPVVPENAEALLVTAFPDLTPEQRRAVIAATEIDSGFPLDASSQGWQRVNLPAAMSSRVTLGADGAVVSVEPGQDAPSVVRPDTAPAPAPAPAPGSVAPAPGSATPGSGAPLPAQLP